MTQKTAEEWRVLLSPLAYHVTREGGTERPYTGALLNESRKGVYRCVCCQHILFTSTTKYHSGCGWPAFHGEAAFLARAALDARNFLEAKFSAAIPTLGIPSGTKACLLGIPTAVLYE